ncbi:MAG: orotidine-5'-phosphate decarboxylase [Pseudomonadota bacterium]
MTTGSLSPRDRLIVALDVADIDHARALADTLNGHVGVFKIGLELAMAGGIDFARTLANDGHAIFLDMKLLDIGNTVTKAVANAAAAGFSFLTVHAYPQAMRAAVAGIGESDLRLLGVTVLTSMDQDDLLKAGYRQTPRDLVIERAKNAVSAGMPGIVCAPQEITAVREAIGQDLILVTPGIRPAMADIGDQKRVATPGNAIADGADYIVVGRPITQSNDPAAAADAIVAEIADTLEKGEEN